MSQAKVGPIYMPWESGHYEEIAVFIVVGLASAILGATLVTHYRKLTGRG